jgi:hypothetical protein
LLAGAGSLRHLVARTVALSQEAFAKPHRAVIHDTSFLKGEEVFVTAMGWDEVFGHGIQSLLSFFVLSVLEFTPSQAETLPDTRKSSCSS